MIKKIRPRTIERDILMDAIINAGNQLKAINKLPNFLLYTLDKNALDKETTKQLSALNDMYRTNLFFHYQPKVKIG